MSQIVMIGTNSVKEIYLNSLKKKTFSGSSFIKSTMSGILEKTLISRGDTSTSHFYRNLVCIHLTVQTQGYYEINVFFCDRSKSNGYRHDVIS